MYEICWPKLPLHYQCIFACFAFTLHRMPGPTHLPLRQRRPTLVSYLMLFLLSLIGFAISIAAVGNARMFLWFNSLGTDVTDVAFNLVTVIGDGLFFGLLCAVALVVDYLAYRRRAVGETIHIIGFTGGGATPWFMRGLCLLFGFALSSGLAQLLKRVVFDEGWLRPRGYFEKAGIAIRQPAGVDMFTYNSFPSGHTTTAFCMAAMLAFFFPKPKGQVLLLAIAWVVAISRVMLGQHFPLDVLAGAALGTACALASRSIFFARRPLQWRRGRIVEREA